MKTKILVVDDDVNIRRTLSDILRVKGYETSVAANGAEAVAAAEQEQFSLALIDLMLPDMSGIEVMARIKNISQLTEAIILTGHATLDSAVEATNKGAFSYLLKPYEIDRLLRHIHRALERREAQQEILRLASFPRMDPDPVLEIGAAGEITYLNPAAERLFPGLSKAQIAAALGMPTVWQRNDGQQVHEIRIGNATFEQYLYQVQLSDLTRIHMRDITARKQVENDLLEAKHELQEFFDLVPDMVCIASAADGCLLQVNKIWETTLGFKSEDLIGRPFVEFIHPEDVEATLAEVKKQLAGLPTINFINRYRNSDGSYKWLEWVAAPAREGKLLYAAARDITARKQADEALMMAHDELVEKSRRLEMFQKVAVNREMRMVEMKEEINGLLKRLGEPIKYREVDNIMHKDGSKP